MVLGTRFFLVYLIICHNVISRLTFDLSYFPCRNWGYLIAPNNAHIDGCGRDCWAYLAVMRISLALVVFHVLLAFIDIVIGLFRRNILKSVENGHWFLKLASLIGIMVAIFLIVPNNALYRYDIAAITLGSLYIIFQSFILIELSWSWVKLWIEKWEETLDSWFKNMLIFFCLLLYVVSIGVNVALILAFGAPKHDGCGLNTYFVSVNIVLSCIHSIVSVLPIVQYWTPHSGIFQSATLFVYTTYLTASAIIYEPAKGEFQCGLGVNSDNFTSIFVSAVGILLAFISLSYCVFKRQCFDDDEHDPLDFHSFQDRRYERILQGDNSLGSEYLDETVSYEHQDVKTSFQFCKFHLTLAAASFFLVMVLTGWSSMKLPADIPNGSLQPNNFYPNFIDNLGNLTIYNRPIDVFAKFNPSSRLPDIELQSGSMPASRSSDNYARYFALYTTHISYQNTFLAMWAKIAAGWASIALYLWRLVRPILFGERHALASMGF